jgi:DNA mismatch repair protein MutL
VVESLALSRPEVGFFLRSDGRRALALPASADLRERISQIHGLSLARSLVALEDPVLWGFVSPLAVSFPTRRYLHVAVNGRVVEADSFAPAVAKAYADLLPKGRHPATFLRLELGPAEVDVDVHPAKSAVRLRGGRSAYPLVVGTIRAALAQEREVGGAPPSEEGGHALTLIGQFAGRSDTRPRSPDLLLCYLRAAELEMRAAEEPLRSDLDVAGLKAQVLGRIEELEAREREREGLLAGLVPAMEAMGFDTGPVKAIMGG